MSQNNRDHKDSAETVFRIIEAIENPDNPKRLEAIAANEARAAKWRMLERYGAILSNLIFIAFALFLLTNMRVENRAGGSYWMGIAVGVGAGLVLILVSKVSRVFNVKPARPAVIFAAATLTLTAIFTADEIRKRTALSTREFISVAAVSFLAVLSAYSLMVNLLSLRKGNSSKGGME